jgi:hypothetical protein
MQLSIRELKEHCMSVFLEKLNKRDAAVGYNSENENYNNNNNNESFKYACFNSRTIRSNSQVVM